MIRNQAVEIAGGGWTTRQARSSTVLDFERCRALRAGPGAASAPRRIYAVTLRKVYQYLVERGVDGTSLLYRTELGESELANPYHQLCPAQARVFYLNALRQAPRAGLGLDIGAATRLSDLGPLGLSQLSSRSLQQALESSHSNRELYHLLVDWSFRKRGRSLVISLRCAETNPDLRRFLLERAMGMVHAHARELLGAPVAPLAVMLDFASPEWGRRYEELFRCPVTFSAGQNEIHYPAVYLDERIATYDPEVLELLDPLHLKLRQKLAARSDVLTEVRLALRQSLGDFPGIEQVAESLAMSSRTLRRKLAQQSVSFQKLLDEARQEIAEDFLLTTGIGMQRIAEHCGFQDPQNFSQAFKRWTGLTPTQFRAQHRPGKRPQASRTFVPEPPGSPL